MGTAESAAMHQTFKRLNSMVDATSAFRTRTERLIERTGSGTLSSLVREGAGALSAAREGSSAGQPADSSVGSLLASAAAQQVRPAAATPHSRRGPGPQPGRPGCTTGAGRHVFPSWGGARHTCCLRPPAQARLKRRQKAAEDLRAAALAKPNERSKEQVPTSCRPDPGTRPGACGTSNAAALTRRVPHVAWLATPGRRRNLHAAPGSLAHPPTRGSGWAAGRLARR